MSPSSLLVVLLVLACLQSFTRAQHATVPEPCCFKFQKSKIPIWNITDYKKTQYHCTKPGIIFYMKSGRRVCADPGVQWVKEHKDKIDKRVKHGG